MCRLLLALSFTMLSACAVGPLVSHETARTVGDRNHELLGGYGQAGYVVKWNYGITDNFDFGVHWESLSIGVRFKYAFLNPSEGFALAGALGAGSSVGGEHYYGDLMASYKSGKWEPYTTVRLVHVKTDPVEFKDKDTGTFDFKIPSASYEYGQATLGTRFWFNGHWLLSAEVSSLFAVTSGLKFSNGVFAGAAFGYRW